MRFLCRAEVGLDAKMNLQTPLLEPDAAARGETRRFGLLGQSQDAGIERPRRFLSVRRHCQLHVFDCVDFHFNYIFWDYMRLTALMSIFRVHCTLHQKALKTRSVYERKIFEACANKNHLQSILCGARPGYASPPACSLGGRRNRKQWTV